MNFKNLKTETTYKITTVTLNRPDKLNVLTKNLLLELRQFLLMQQESTNDIQGLILTGAGTKAFSAGGDLKYMSQLGALGGEELSKLAQDVTIMIEKLAVPVIACVDGFALGGGCELAMSCDFIYATKRSKFGQPETKVGLTPGFGGNFRLAQLVGPAKAKELIYTGRQILADEAQKIGLVNQVFDSREELLKAAINTLNEIKENSSFAVATAKNILNFNVGQSIEASFSYERKKYGSLFEHPEKTEGIQAFLEKRIPRFQ